MRQLRKTLALLLAVLTITSTLSLPVQAAELPARAFTQGEEARPGANLDWSYNPEDGALRVTGTGTMDDFSAENPAPWAEMAAGIRTVELAKGVTSIGEAAFAGCVNLASVTLPDGLQSVGQRAFLDCAKLKNIELPESVTSIGAYAFGYYGEALNQLAGITLTGGAAAESYARLNPHVTCKPIEQAPENPRVASLTLLERGVAVKWNAVSGVKTYKLYYRQDGGSWKSAGTTTSTSKSVTGLTSGKKYTFAVVSLWTKGEVAVQAQRGKSITFVAAPTVSSVNAGTKAGTATVKWNKVTGAGKYRVFCKTGSGGWKKAGDTTGTSFTVSGLKAGNTYSFTVRCLSSNGKQYVSAYHPTGKRLALTAVPTLTMRENVDGGVRLTWSRVSGAAKYRVFYRTGSGSWKKLQDTASTTLTVKNLTSSQTYVFTLRTISADGKQYTSGYNTSGWKQTYLAAPKLTSAVNGNDGVALSWNAVSGVSKYRVFYKVNGSGWKKYQDVTGTSITVRGLTGGSRYTFTVRGVNTAATSYTTGYDSTGRSVTYIEPPVLSQVLYDGTGITVDWEPSDGAAKYRVFFKKGNSWARLGDTTNTSFYTTALDNRTSYTFTVRCVNAAGTSYTSGFDARGIEPEYIPGQPRIYDFSSSYQSSRFYSQLMSLDLGTNPRDNLVDVAMSQLGYTEGNSYGRWSGTTGGGNNYTEFGLWYNNHISGGGGFYAGAWCCMFVSWCANEAGIPTSTIPRRALVEDMDDWFGGRYYTWNETACGYGSKKIQKGDLIIYSASAGGRLSHIGIVTGVEYKDSYCVISTVEGNVDDACRTRRFIMAKSTGGRVDGSHYIRGFCCPNY